MRNGLKKVKEKKGICVVLHISCFLGGMTVYLCNNYCKKKSHYFDELLSQKMSPSKAILKLNLAKALKCPKD